MTRYISRILCAVLAVMLLISVLPGTASAAEYTLIKGQPGDVPFGMMAEADCEYKLYGQIPGMSLEQFRGAMILTGTPTTAGEYSVTLVVTKGGQEVASETVTVSVVEPETPTEVPDIEEGTPKITKHPTAETVVEGDSAAFIARADNTRQYVWEILLSDGSTVSCSGQAAVLQDVTVSGDGTEKLVLGNIPLALDGCKVRCRFVGAESSVYSDYALITVKPKEDVKPVITKHPTGETVEEGGMAQFVARADHATDYVWSILSPDGAMSYPLTGVPAAFAELEISGNYTECLTLSNIPYALNGWEVLCEISGPGGSATTNGARLVVDLKATEPTETEPPVTETTQPTEPSTEAPTEPSTEAPTELEPTVQTEPVVTEPPVKKEEGSNSALALIAIICICLVVIAAIAAYVVLRLKGVIKPLDREEYLDEDEEFEEYEDYEE